jgi:hypothetical protein
MEVPLMSEPFDHDLRSLRAHIDGETATLPDDVGDLRRRAGRQRRARAFTAASALVIAGLVVGAGVTRGSRPGAQESIVGAGGVVARTASPGTSPVGPGPGGGEAPPGTGTAPTTVSLPPYSTAPPPTASPPPSVSVPTAPVTTAPLVTPRSWPAESRDASGAYPCDTASLDPEYSRLAPEPTRIRFYIRYRNVGPVPCWMEGYATATLRNFERTISANFVPLGTSTPHVLLAPRAAANIILFHDMGGRTAANCPNPAPVRYLTTSQQPYWQFDDPLIWEDGGPGAMSGWCASDTFSAQPLSGGE